MSYLSFPPRPDCAGSPASEVPGPHAAHGYWTRHWESWLICPGWTEREEVAATAIESARDYCATHPMSNRDDMQIEMHPGLLHDIGNMAAALTGFLNRDASDRPVIEPFGVPPNALFGFPVRAVETLAVGEWRFVQKSLRPL